MDLDLPDPITNYNRQQARQRYQRREEYILGHHPGFNLLYWRRIVRTPGRVGRLGARLGWSPDQIMLTKALLISRMACVFIDHIIHRMEQADLLTPATGGPHAEWENQYHHFLLLFLRQADIPDRREIVKLMQRLHRYTLPPLTLLEFRRRHWRAVERLLPPLLNSQVNAPAPLAFRRPLSRQGRPATLARRICFAAALYSDIQERRYHQQWMFAYSDCMLRLYDRLRRTPAILAALLELT